MTSDPKQAHTLTISPSEFTICAGATFSYKIQAKYYISLSSKILGECQDFELINNLLKVVFYQKDGDKVLMYDNQIRLVLTALANDSPAPAPVVSAPALPPSLNSLPGPIVLLKPTPSTGFTPNSYLLLLLFFRSLGRKKV